jgi:hypothetical protein
MNDLLSMIHKCNFIGACTSSISILFGIYILIKESTFLDLVVNILMLGMVSTVAFGFGLSFLAIGKVVVKNRNIVIYILSAMIIAGSFVGLVSISLSTTNEILPELVAVLGIYCATKVCS